LVVSCSDIVGFLLKTASLQSYSTRNLGMFHWD